MIERINLIPDDIRREKRALRKKPLIAVFLVIYAAFLTGVYFYQDGKVKSRLAKIEDIKKEMNELMAQNERYKGVIEKIDQAQKREDDIRKRLDVIGSLLENRIYWSGILRNIAHILPDGVWLSSLSTSDLPGKPGKGIKFNGTSVSNSGIAEFVFGLENFQSFGNVLLNYSQKREFQGRDLYDFEITADLR